MDVPAALTLNRPAHATAGAKAVVNVIVSPSLSYTAICQTSVPIIVPSNTCTIYAYSICMYVPAALTLNRPAYAIAETKAVVYVIVSPSLSYIDICHTSVPITVPSNTYSIYHYSIYEP